MTKSEPIRILHLTDSHISAKSQEHLKRRVLALIKYLNATNTKVDIIVFTGDLTLSGKPEEFEIFERLVAEPLRSQLRIHKSKFVFIPGNHDIDRDQVTATELGRRSKLETTADAESEMGFAETKWPRLSAFKDYFRKNAPTSPDYAHTEFSGGLYSTRRINHVKGVNIGIALLNSAWLCANDEDKGKLFLTEQQIREVTDSLRTCDIRIALCHHPRDWFHESETDLALNDLHRDFSLILTGHLHKPVSTKEVDATGDSVSLLARALFDGKTTADTPDGFHLYEIDIPNRRIVVYFRKYIRKRNTYDKDTDHADDGKHTFHLPIPVSLASNSSLLVQRLSGEASQLELEIRETLARLQGVDEPVLVKPKVRSFQFRKGSRQTIKGELTTSELLQQNTVLCGDRDAGKSILLKTLASQAHSISPPELGRSSATYVADIPPCSWEDQNALLTFIENHIQHKNEDINGFHLILVVDGILQHHSARLELLSDLCSSKGWTYVASVSGHDVVNVLSQDPKYSDVLFAEVRPWGPSRIREFTAKLFEGTDLDPELAYKAVHTCLRTIDIPSNPAIVCLYVSAFSKVGSKLSSLSFLRFLEKIEQIKLGIDEDGTIHSLYNRQRVLMLLAINCLHRGDISISQGRALDIVDEHFRPSKLKADPKEFLQFIIRSGVLNSKENSLEFSNYVFWDYYLAMAFKEGLLSEDGFTSSISRCARVTSALSLFAGMKRENIHLAEKALAIVEHEFADAGRLELKDLDRHIKGLLLEESRSVGEADSVTQETFERSEDPEVADEEYDRQRKRVAENRKALMSRGLDDSFDDLSAKIEGLHAFYSILRNLENIDAARKEEMIDRILDFHISTNFHLIDFYFQYSESEEFRTYAAYMLTWGGHSFMAASLGNPTMCDSICDVLAKTQNDFKKLLLLLLLSELGDSRACKLIESFSDSCESRAANEILFVQTRRRLVDYQSLKLPVDLIGLFKKLFVLRQTKFGGAKSASDVKVSLGKAVSDINVEHRQQWREKWADGDVHKKDHGPKSPIVDV
jgi:predicted phosphodiesterase